MSWVDISASGLLKDGGVYQIGLVAPPDWTAAAVKTAFETAPPGLPGGKFSIDSVAPGTSGGAVSSWRFQGTWHGSPVVVSTRPVDAPGIQYAAVFEQVPDPPPPPPPPPPVATPDAATPVAYAPSRSGVVLLEVLAAGAALGVGVYFILKYQHAQALSNPVAIIKVCGCGKRYTRADWEELPLVAAKYDTQGDGSEILEMRNCSCRSTLVIDVTPPKEPRKTADYGSGFKKRNHVRRGRKS